MRSAKRILIAGTAGAGKSTLAQRIAECAGMPYLEIDSLFHGPSWTRRPSFVEEVDQFTSQECWVCEWQYAAVRPLLAQRAEILVWLDYPVPLVMWRVVKRTALRWLRNQELWNGNREPGMLFAITNREGIIRWAWDTRHKTSQLVRELESSHPHLQIVRLRTPAQARAWAMSASSRP